ncbi:hypothetical protein F5B18DRAFT_674415 [Nemania serpens]|nr:hypothetical protein F5B18DRAFT_674415 [Nemania serpens]
MEDMPPLNDSSDSQRGFQDDTFNNLDDLFPGVDFSDQVNVDFEAMLAEGFPVQEQPKPTSPKLEEDFLEPSNKGYAEQPDESIPTTLDPGNETSLQQPPFIDPMQLYGAPQLTYNPQNYVPADNTNINWGLPQQHGLNDMLAQDPIFRPQVYPQYFPTSNQINGQPMVQQPALAQPQSTNMYMNGQQAVYQQPGNPGYQMPWLAQYQPVQQLAQPTISTTSQAIPQTMPQPIPQAIPQPMPQTVPQLMAQPASVSISQVPKAPTTVDDRRDSDLPDPKDASRHSKRPPSAGTVTTSPPIKRPAKNHHGEALLNDKIPRKTHTKKGPNLVEPERYYGPSPSKPKDWGPVDKNSGRSLFTYTEKGELAAGLFFTARQMRQYLLGPSRYDDFEPPARLPGVKKTSRKFRQGLTLWIGWPASMANKRYPRGGESTKCRFKNCQYRHTIQVGDPWVIMDERQNVDGEVIDPFHNAGYVHLYCLESHFDIVDLWHCIDIRPDYRSFKRESHPYFSLGYKLPGVDDRLQAWWANAFRAWELARGLDMKRPRSHNTSLAQCLVEYKLAHEPKGQTKNRQKRGGIDMAKHLGDPELKRKLQKFRKYGLLDESGAPVVDADSLLEDIENEQRQTPQQGATPLAPLQPGLDPVQQLYRGQQGGLEHAYAGTVPAYDTAPIDPAAHLVCPNPPTSTLAAPDMPAETSGHKRSRDEFAVDISEEFHQAARESSAGLESKAPSPKRQRLEDTAPPPPQPDTQTSTLATPDMPAETRGQKRSRDEVADEISDAFYQAAHESSAGLDSKAPSPKRQRLENPAPPYPQLVTQPTHALNPTNAPGFPGNPGVESQDTLATGGVGHSASKKRSRPDDSAEEPESKRIKTELHQLSFDDIMGSQLAGVPSIWDPAGAIAPAVDPLAFLDEDALGLDVKLDASVFEAFLSGAQEVDDDGLLGGTDEHAESGAQVADDGGLLVGTDEHAESGAQEADDGGLLGGTDEHAESEPVAKAEPVEAEPSPMLAGEQGDGEDSDGENSGLDSLFGDPETDMKSEASASPPASPKAGWISPLPGEDLV